YGLDLTLFDEKNEIQWERSMPFKVHAICNGGGRIGILAAHAFYLLNTVDGSMVHEGRSCPGGFLQLLNRPGGGWVVSGRDGNLHLFDVNGIGIRRIQSGIVRRLIGWLDREHLLWQDANGVVYCGQIAQQDKRRVVDSTVWSWVSPLIDGRTLLQSADGQLWDGIPHPYGWDHLERIEIESLEPLMATRAADGWWVLGIEGHLDHMTSNSEEVRVGEGMSLGDLLIRLGPNSMVTCRRDGLIRRWVAPHLAEEQRRHRQKEAADAKLARSWDERRQLFERAQTAEDEGRLSRAVELYEALGRMDDVQRLLRRQKGGGDSES
ncbi:MAG: hypothetical protein VX778_05270, partial [Candidatus Thermoplasmatota archaeon]|nr:hypothetical protein [Candidatus Thermoplasmatota archaeon]